MEAAYLDHDRLENAPDAEQKTENEALLATQNPHESIRQELHDLSVMPTWATPPAVTKSRRQESTPVTFACRVE
jgi:hypothetical protein